MKAIDRTTHGLPDVLDLAVVDMPVVGRPARISAPVARRAYREVDSRTSMTRHAMNDALGLPASAIGLILVPVCLVRLVLGRADLAALYRAPGGDGWPHGVQEADCPRWRLDEGRDPRSRGLTGRAPVHGAATVEPGLGSIDETAWIEPQAGDDLRTHLVQPRAAVRARIALVVGSPARRT